MSKRFVKNRYPEAFSVKTHGWLSGDPFIIYDKRGGTILKGCDVDEKKAWVNIKNIIKNREKLEKNLTPDEVIARRLEIAKLEIARVENKYGRKLGY